MSSTDSSTNDIVKKTKIRFNRKKHSNIPKNPVQDKNIDWSSDEIESGKLELTNYKELEELNHRKRKADRNYNKKLEQAMENDEKRIKLESLISEDENVRVKMFQLYQPWVLSTYGDDSKSKTITLKKQTRILSALKGLEIKDNRRPDSSKFKFWVKSKGFVINDAMEDHERTENSKFEIENCKLLVPSRSVISNIFFKRVAVVEFFFDIIYKVHCSIGPNETRHVGQKRTYRKITEYFAFLPREAVTKFLTQCEGCLQSSKFRNSKKHFGYDKMKRDKYSENSVLTNELDDEEFTKNSRRNNIPPNEDRRSLDKEWNYASRDPEKILTTSSADNQCTRDETVEDFKLSSRFVNDVGSDHALKHETLREFARVSIEFQKRVSNLEAVPHINSLASQMCDKISINTNYGDIVPETTHPTGLLSLGAYKNRHYNNSVDSTQPITSLYLMMTRSMGLNDEDALNLFSFGHDQCFLSKLSDTQPTAHQTFFKKFE